MSKTYDSSSIDALVKSERIRTRPASVLGSDGLAGARHGLIELVGNAVDEKTAGFGDKLELCYYEDASISIRDYGRGVPMKGINKKLNIPTYLAIFSELYAGGKYNTYQDELLEIDRLNEWDKFNPQDYNYLFSIGLNGLGAASTQMTSSYFTVRSYRDGEMYEMYFEEGEPAWEELKIEPTDEPNGTYIKWRPDPKVFTETDVKGDFVRSIALSTAYISGLDVYFKDEKKNTEEEFKAGTIVDLLLNKYKNDLDRDNVLTTNGLNHGHTIEKGKDAIYIFKYDMAVSFVDNKGGISAYHNAIEMKGNENISAHHQGVFTALDRFFLQKAKENGVKFNKQNYRDKVVVAISSFSNIASYANQTKDLVDNNFILYGVENALFRLLNIEYEKGNELLNNLIDQLIEEAYIQAELEATRKQLKQVQKVTKSRKKVDKFYASKAYRNNIVTDSVLFIVEGDSAAGGVANARNAATQAIYPIKGKIINAAKATLEKVLNNKEVQDIFQLMGGGMEIQGTDQHFEMDKMKFEKIIILTDADIDGFQIRVLLFLLFMKYSPEIIEQGRLYIANSPLFNMFYKDEVRYALTLEHKEEIEKQYGKPIQIERNKGLGQVDASVLAKTTIDPKYTEYKNLIQIKFDTNNIKINELVDVLFGKDVRKRRKSLLLELLGSDLMDMIDENSQLLDFLDENEEEDELEVETINL